MTTEPHGAPRRCPVNEATQRPTPGRHHLASLQNGAKRGVTLESRHAAEIIVLHVLPDPTTSRALHLDLLLERNDEGHV